MLESIPIFVSTIYYEGYITEAEETGEGQLFIS